MGRGGGNGVSYRQKQKEATSKIILVYLYILGQSGQFIIFSYSHNYSKQKTTMREIREHFINLDVDHYFGQDVVKLVNYLDNLSIIKRCPLLTLI